MIEDILATLVVIGLLCVLGAVLIYQYHEQMAKYKDRKENREKAKKKQNLN